MKADLHIHSNYSDSDFSMEKIFMEAKKAGLACISVTDHDTVGSIEQTKNLGDKYNVEFLTGIEISAEKQGFEVHILGYCADFKNGRFLKYFGEVEKIRRERLVLMGERVTSLGMKVDINELLNKVKDRMPTRLHLAVYMEEKGFVSSVWEAFVKYLSVGKPAYVGRFKLSVEEAIEMIVSAGGVPVLAHPHFLPDEKWIEEFAQKGIRGIEVIYPKYTPEKIARYSRIAENLGLLKSGGSDCHGKYKRFTRIGGVIIPYRWVEDLKNERRRIFHAESI